MISKSYCTGCGACMLSCPKKCIEMKTNKIGELVPFIDTNKCVGCKICENICPQNNVPNMVKPSLCYAAWSKNEEDWIYSASGGIGVVFSRWAKKHGGEVYGCDYDENGDLKHFCVRNERDLERIQSSKYSQSEAYLTFEEIKEKLDTEFFVLFVGTPCQVAGLRNFLKKEYLNLLTIDLVCHGTPPNIYLKNYLKKMGFRSPHEKIRFRGEYDQKLTLWNKGDIAYSKSYDEDLYFSSFYANMISRNSCYFCQYAQTKRCSDITIGDFWGLGKLTKIKKYSKRPSLILVNTERGKCFVQEVSEELFIEERSVEEGIKGNGRLNCPPNLSGKAKIFQKLYPYFGFCSSARIARILFPKYCKYKMFLLNKLSLLNKVIHRS